MPSRNSFLSAIAVQLVKYAEEFEVEIAVKKVKVAAKDEVDVKVMFFKKYA